MTLSFPRLSNSLHYYQVPLTPRQPNVPLVRGCPVDYNSMRLLSISAETADTMMFGF